MSIIICCLKEELSCRKSICFILLLNKGHTSLHLLIDPPRQERIFSINKGLSLKLYSVSVCVIVFLCFFFCCDKVFFSYSAKHMLGFRWLLSVFTWIMSVLFMRSRATAYIAEVWSSTPKPTNKHRTAIK